MTETEELSAETMELVGKAVRQSEKLSDDDSLDDVFRHLATTYLIENMNSDELSESDEERAEALREQARLKQQILDHI